MKTLEKVLEDALNGLRAYPDSMEELATQLNMITEACAREADNYGLAYQEEDKRISEVV